MKKVLSFYLFLFGLTILTTTCKKKLFKKVTYEGYVFDSKNSGKPVEGLSVTISGCDGAMSGYTSCRGNLFTIGSARTDASGHFYIHARDQRNNIYFLNVQNSSWNTSSGYVGLPPSILYVH